MKEKVYDVIVIGGGAAGLMAAGRAGQLGLNVLLLEKKNEFGKKLKITGKGRCNLTNLAPKNEFLNHIKPSKNFLKTAFHQFFNDDLKSFFNDLGVETVDERGGRVFTKSGKAAEVVSALVSWVKDQGVSFRTDWPVSGIIEEHRIFSVQSSRASVFKAHNVIIATGGKSYPSTGSTGDGYRLAKSLGHKITDIRPALVPLETESIVAEYLTGLKLRNVGVSIFLNQKRLGSGFGEMGFFDKGVNGPVILTLSDEVVENYDDKSSMELILDLKPALSHKQLDQRLIREIETNRRKQINSVLASLLPKQMIPFCMNQLDINSRKVAGDVSAEERKRLRLWLKELRIKITGYRPIDEAIVTAGGISLKEINSKTMASRLVQGLYFCGEVMDIHADTGGFNLQVAFSSARLAVESIHKSLN